MLWTSSNPPPAPPSPFKSDAALQEAWAKLQRATELLASAAGVELSDIPTPLQAAGAAAFVPVMPSIVRAATNGVPAHTGARA